MARNRKKRAAKTSAIVFGGSGFLGSHVADALTEGGHSVVIYDSKPSPYLREGQRMVVGDILDRSKAIRAASGCSVVYNFAGIADLDDASTKPLDTVQLNVTGNLNVMDAALAAKAKRFVYASTIYAYSEKGGFYRCSKQASELYIEEYQRHYGLDFTILRYGTLYGPRADQRNSIFRYLRSALNDGMVICQGSGEEIREYIHVRDAAKLSVDVLDPLYRNQHITISGHHPVKFKDMIYMMREILGRNIKIRFTDARNTAHYDYTPYSFIPKIGKKLTHSFYQDMGQGLLECAQEIHKTIKN